MWAAIVAVLGTLYQGYTQSSASRQNAKIEERKGNIARSNSKAEAMRIRRATRRRIGAGKAAIGANGIAFEGSAMDVLEAGEIQGEKDALEIIRLGNESANISDINAAADRQRARNAETGAILQSASQLLSK